MMLIEGNNMTDNKYLAEAIYTFNCYIRHKDSSLGFISNNKISFDDLRGYLARAEGYKNRIYVKARETLSLDKWNNIRYKTGAVSNYAIKAINKSGNLISHYQVTDFKNKLSDKEMLSTTDDIIYNIYCTDNDKKSFNDAIDFFGKKYDLIAFLFFLKSNEKFLPIRSSLFDRAFEYLKIDCRTAYKCSWENYCDFIATIKHIKEILSSSSVFDKPLTLLDAHSFAWIVQQDDFQNYKCDEKGKEEQVETIHDKIIEYFNENPEKRTSQISKYVRDKAIIKEAKRQAQGICQLCNNEAPFNDKNGEPYLEVHHINWLSNGGQDTISNAIALCPNCHSKMHVVNDEKDISYLRNKKNNI